MGSNSSSSLFSSSYLLKCVHTNSCQSRINQMKSPFAFGRILQFHPQAISSYWRGKGNSGQKRALKSFWIIVFKIIFSWCIIITFLRDVMGFFLWIPIRSWPPNHYGRWKSHKCHLIRCTFRRDISTNGPSVVNSVLHTNQSKKTVRGAFKKCNEFYAYVKSRQVIFAPRISMVVE